MPTGEGTGMFARRRSIKAAAPDITRADIAGAIAREEVSGLATLFWGRVAALTLLALWVLLTLPIERSKIYLVAIIIFALLGAPSYLLARRGIRSTLAIAFFLLLDASILTYILIVPPP